MSDGFVMELCGNRAAWQIDLDGIDSIDLETVGRFDGPVLLGEELHLIMIWQEWDGKVHQTSIYLGRLLAS